MYTSLDNVGGTPEGCAAWCLSFRAPGFVGFVINACECNYDHGHLPDPPAEAFDVNSYEIPTGIGAVSETSFHGHVTCYPVAVRPKVI